MLAVLVRWGQEICSSPVQNPGYDSALCLDRTGGPIPRSLTNEPDEALRLSGLGRGAGGAFSSEPGCDSASLPGWGQSWKCSLFENPNQADFHLLYSMGQLYHHLISASEQSHWLGLLLGCCRLECVLPQSKCCLLQAPHPSPSQSYTQWSRPTVFPTFPVEKGWSGGSPEAANNGG